MLEALVALLQAYVDATKVGRIDVEYTEAIELGPLQIAGRGGGESGPRGTWWDEREKYGNNRKPGEAPGRRRGLVKDVRRCWAGWALGFNATPATVLTFMSSLHSHAVHLNLAASRSTPLGTIALPASCAKLLAFMAK